MLSTGKKKQRRRLLGNLTVPDMFSHSNGNHKLSDRCKDGNAKFDNNNFVGGK